MNYYLKKMKLFPHFVGLVGLMNILACYPNTNTAQAPTTETTRPNDNTSPVAQNETPFSTPSSTPFSTPPTNTQSQTASQLLQLASNSGSYKTLAKVVNAGGLNNNLQSLGGTYTIFAPTDEAFAALPQATLTALLKPENRGILNQILAYHVLPGEYSSIQLKSGNVKTLNGNVLVQVSSGEVNVNKAKVVEPDIIASNAVIHGINQVLIPANVQQKLNSLK
jgi:uncharacterized surface protein with fasciclin (FAS1) repeats